MVSKSHDAPPGGGQVGESLFPVGAVLTRISNTSATLIGGVFDNRPDGLVFTDGSIFQVIYDGALGMTYGAGRSGMAIGA